jgi:amino acid transporter
MADLRRGISKTGVLILGTGGVVGTGALFGSTGMAASAGPALVVSWIVASIIYSFIGVNYIDLGIRYPEAGGPCRYSLYTHGRFTNLITSISSLVWYVFIPPIEAVAVVEGLTYFDPSLLNSSGTPSTAGALVAFGLIVIFVPLNYFGIQFFHRLTNALGGLKLVIYLLLAAGVIIFLGHGSAFTRYHGFAPFGFSGILAAVPVAMFAFGGIRVLPDFSEELSDAKDLKVSIIVSLIGQAIIYTLFGLAFVMAIDWSKLGVGKGIWGKLGTVSGNPFVLLTTHRDVVVLLVLAVVVAIIGPFGDGYVYQGAGSRVLLAIGRSGYGPNRLKEVSERHGIPVWGLLSLAGLGAVITLLTAPVPTIYTLINDAVVAGYLGFASVPISMLAVRGRNRSLAATIVGAAGFAGASLVVYWSGWPSVPYGLVVTAVLIAIFAVVSDVGDWAAGVWYVVYAAFLLLMAAIGSVGYKDVVSFDLGTVIVIVVSVVVFLPWAVRSRLASTNDADASVSTELPGSVKP